MRDRPPHVLVVYGSKRGGTAEIADAIVETLLAEGVDADLAGAAGVDSIDDYDAVIIGGALYMNRWHRDARRFVHRHADALRTRPVWLFSSGPLDDSATQRDIPPPGSVAAYGRRIGARGHITFGGRLAPDATGFPARQMAKTHAGDWRAWQQIRGWAKSLVPQLQTPAPEPVVIAPAPSSKQRWLLAALCWFVALTAIGGGLTLALRPDGSLLDATPSMLSHSPFSSFLVPGLLLLVVIGFGSAVAGVMIVRSAPRAVFAAFFAGGALLVWITTEMILLRTHHWIQIGYFTLAAIILIEAWKVFELPSRHGRAARHPARQLS
jgi:menaquinone-dependent protoporphyrinogen oxidase